MSPKNEQSSSISTAVHDRWRELAIYRQGLEERLGRGDIQQAQDAFAELTAKTQVYDQLLQEQAALFRELVGKNFLGPEEWKGAFKVDVDRPPPIPEYISEQLLQSACPLHPGEVIKDTHLLTLIPKNVSGEPYTPVVLDRLCDERGRLGHFLIAHLGSEWKSYGWANEPQARVEWMLIPKADPLTDQVAQGRSFRSKCLDEQLQVLKEYHKDYRQAKVVESMTAQLLNDVVNKDPLMSHRWEMRRCLEETKNGYHFVVGGSGNLFGVRDDYDDVGYGAVGLAIVRSASVQGL